MRQKKQGKGNPWWVFINHQGKRKAMKIGDKETADKVAKDIRRKLASGEYSLKSEEGGSKSPKFRELARDWLENDIRVLRRPATYERYNQLLVSHILPTLGGKRIDEITRGEIKDFFEPARTRRLKCPHKYDGEKNYTLCQIHDMARFIHTHPFWRSQIEQIYETVQRLSGGSTD